MQEDKKQINSGNQQPTSKQIKKLNGVAGGLGGVYFGPKFENQGLVGAGSYGEVYRVKHRESGKIYAIKVYQNIFANRILALRTVREIMILRRINNERIIKIYDILPPPNMNKITTISVLL
jgi:serine/threonine protein kinase